MSALAILLEACFLAHVQDPTAFYSLPEYAQGMWLAHARNKVTGVYHRNEQTPDEKKAAMKERALAAARERGVLPPVED